MKPPAPTSTTSGPLIARVKDLATASPTATEGSSLGSIEEETDEIAQIPLTTAANTAPTARGRRAYGQRRINDEHKRERNRATFRRFYQHRQETLHTLRGQVADLTEQYEQIKLSNHVTDPSIMRLVAEKDRLTTEHAALELVAQEQLKARRWPERLIDHVEQDASTLSFVPPPSVDLLAVRHQAIDHLHDIIQVDALPPQHIAFGWHCWSQLQVDDSVAFHVTKQFPATALPVAQTAQRTWELCSASTALSRTSSVAQISRRISSRVADEKTTRLVYRQFVRVDGNYSEVGTVSIQSAKSVYAVTLMPLTSGAWAVVSYSVPNQEVYDPVDDLHIVSELFRDSNARYSLDVLLGAMVRQADDEWIKKLSWWRIEPLGTSVRVTYAGRASVCLGLSPSACFMDVLQRVVEWEQIVLGTMQLGVTTLDTVA